MTNPPPKPNDNTPSWEVVIDRMKSKTAYPDIPDNVREEIIKDMKGRDEKGQKAYGTRLQAFNTRNALLDMYEELLDAVVYCETAIIEYEINFGLNIQNDMQYSMLSEHFDYLIDMIVSVKIILLSKKESK